MTTESPEVATVRGRLDALPAVWLPPGFAEAVVARASILAAHRELAERLQAATDARDAALVQIGLGVDLDAALGGLTAATEALTAIDAAQYVLPEPALPPDLCARVLAAALTAVDGARTGFRVTSCAYLAEVRTWQQALAAKAVHEAPPDLPRSTTEDLAAEKADKAARSLTAGWESTATALQANRSLGVSGQTSVLDLLAAAADLVGQAPALAARVEELNVVIRAANAVRGDVLGVCGERRGGAGEGDRRGAGAARGRGGGACARGRVPDLEGVGSGFVEQGSCCASQEAGERVEGAGTVQGGGGRS
jgi:hypothetical protein